MVSVGSADDLPMPLDVLVAAVGTASWEFVLRMYFMYRHVRKVFTLDVSNPNSAN